MMEKTAGRARLRQLFAAVSVLGVSLGMADVANAAKEDATTQTSHKGQASLKIDSQRSIKGESQHSIKYGGQSSYKEQSSIKYGGQSSLKLDQSSQKVQGSYKEQSSVKYGGQQSHKLPPPGGQSSVKGEAQ